MVTAASHWTCIPHWQWFTFEYLYAERVALANIGAKFVEVGSFLGRSACFMGTMIRASNKNIEFTCIDSWDNFAGFDQDQKAQIDVLAALGIPPNDLMYSFNRNVKGCGLQDYIKTCQARSVDAAGQFKDGSLDFVFLDASHDYKNVLDDILAWFPKVKHMGIIAGHDYGNDHPEVEQAVDRVYRSNVIKLTSQQSWMVVNDF